jgi:hypothetical protein
MISRVGFRPSKEIFAMLAIPDTIQGAVVISVIDFILSFVIISAIGVILALLPMVNRLVKLDDAQLKQGH